jgi:hypothetical protein
MQELNSTVKLYLPARWSFQPNVPCIFSFQIKEESTADLPETGWWLGHNSSLTLGLFNKAL